MEQSIMSCTLCTKEPLKPQPYSDTICWVTYCITHGTPLIVLNRHTDSPTAGEWHHMETIGKKLFPGTRWRTPRSMPEHFHFHAER